MSVASRRAVAEPDQRGGAQVGELAVGDVAHDPDQGGHGSARIGAEVGGAPDPPQGTVVGASHTKFDIARDRPLRGRLRRRIEMTIGFDDQGPDIPGGMLRHDGEAEDPAELGRDAQAVGRGIEDECADAACLLRVGFVHLVEMHAGDRRLARLGTPEQCQPGLARLDEGRIAIDHRPAQRHHHHDLPGERQQRLRLRRRQAGRPRHAVDDT